MLLSRPLPSLPQIQFSGHPRRRCHHQPRRLGTKIRALDAAQPFDLESRASTALTSKSHLKIAIISFGNFGQFLARTISAQGHTLLAHSRSDYSSLAETLNVSFFQDPHDLCEQHPDVVLLSTSILSAALVLRSLPIHSLRRDTLFADVLSVKEFPKNLLPPPPPPAFRHPLHASHVRTRVRQERLGWPPLRVRQGPDQRMSPPDGLRKGN